MSAIQQRLKQVPMTQALPSVSVTSELTVADRETLERMQVPQSPKTSMASMMTQQQQQQQLSPNSHNVLLKQLLATSKLAAQQQQAAAAAASLPASADGTRPPSRSISETTEVSTTAA